MDLVEQCVAAGIPGEVAIDFEAEVNVNPRYAAWRELPTVDNVFEYWRDVDSENAAQAKWDARQRKKTVGHPCGYRRGILGV